MALRLIDSCERGGTSLANLLAQASKASAFCRPPGFFVWWSAFVEGGCGTSIEAETNDFKSSSMLKPLSAASSLSLASTSGFTSIIRPIVSVQFSCNQDTMDRLARATQTECRRATNGQPGSPPRPLCPMGAANPIRPESEGFIPRNSRCRHEARPPLLETGPRFGSEPSGS